MVKHALGEGLTSGVGPQVGGEAEGLVDGQVRLHVEHGRAHHLRLLEDVAATAVQHSVDATDGVLGALQEERAVKIGFGDGFKSATDCMSEADS